MTRINIIPVDELMDLHLLAERKEIVRVPKYLEKSIKAGKVNIPTEYRMGTGHVKFFYDKGRWLENRLDTVLVEMIKRKMNPDLTVSYRTDIFKSMGFYNDYIPTDREIQINRDRINHMISLKPHLYKKTPTTDWMTALACSGDGGSGIVIKVVTAHGAKLYSFADSRL